MHEDWVFGTTGNWNHLLAAKQYEEVFTFLYSCLGKSMLSDKLLPSAWLLWLPTGLSCVVPWIPFNSFIIRKLKICLKWTEHRNMLALSKFFSCVHISQGERITKPVRTGMITEQVLSLLSKKRNKTFTNSSQQVPFANLFLWYLGSLAGLLHREKCVSVWSWEKILNIEDCWYPHILFGV